MRRHSLIPLAGLLACIAVLSGCGLEYKDTRAQFRPATDHDHGVNIEPAKLVCPNMVLLRPRSDDLEKGDVRDAFGPYVPCNTLLDSESGTCPTCQQSYGKGAAGPEALSEQELASAARRAVQQRVAGRGNDEHVSAQVTVAPIPAVLCPYEDCGKVLSFGSDGLERVTEKTASLGPNYCFHPDCRRYVSFIAEDVITAVMHKEELLCPACSSPVDPTLNICGNKGACPLKGVLLNTNPIEAPCWSCGGQSLCPNCKGSGKGSSGNYDVGDWGGGIKSSTTPKECYRCEGSGVCPECEDGFLVYEPSLPPEFDFHSGRGDTMKVVPAAKRKWQHAKPGKGGGFGGEGGGGGGEGE